MGRYLLQRSTIAQWLITSSEDISCRWRKGCAQGFIMWRRAGLAGRAAPLAAPTRRSGLRPPVLAGRTPGGLGQIASQKSIYSQPELARSSPRAAPGCAQIHDLAPPCREPGTRRPCTTARILTWVQQPGGVSIVLVKRPASLGTSCIGV